MNSVTLEMKKQSWNVDHVTTSRGLSEVVFVLQLCVDEAVTPSSGISMRTSRDSSPSGQMTTVASRLASVQT